MGYEEKETDVSTAVTLVEYGVTDRFDMALLITADSDICPAVPPCDVFGHSHA